MVDITAPETRTRRLSFLDSFMPIGFLIGLPLGVYIKNNCGYITVFSIASCVIFTCILYVIFMVKEKKRIVEKSEESEDDELKIKLDKSKEARDWVRCLISFIFSLFKYCGQDDGCWGENDLQKEETRRENLHHLLRDDFHPQQGNRQRGGDCELLVLPNAVQTRRQQLQQPRIPLHHPHAGLSGKQNLTQSRRGGGITTTHVQVLLVPFMSSVLKWRDTTILMIAVFCAIVGQFVTALFRQMWILYLCYVLFMLWNTITTTSRSNMSKLMESNEIGKAFSFLAVFQSILPFATKPFFAFFYKHTLETFPGAYRMLTGGLYSVVLVIIILTHFGLKRLEKRNSRVENQEESESLKQKL